MLKDVNDPALEEEIERELNTMIRLDHENIVRIYGAFPVADTGNTGTYFTSTYKVQFLFIIYESRKI